MKDGAFESSVIPSGSKTVSMHKAVSIAFESSVIPSGSKTSRNDRPRDHGFESSVIPSGSKTRKTRSSVSRSLRVV